MRKMLGIIIALMLLLSVAMAENEITFQNVPWLSDDTTVIQNLIDVGYLRNGADLTFARDDATYLLEDDVGFVSPDRISGADDVVYTATLEGEVKGKIAGNPVKDLKLTFAYDGEYKLIAVNAELIGADYDTLKTKLSKVYGGANTVETEEGIISNVWKGENNSAVLLITYSEGLSYTLMYGRLDAAEIISQCLAPADPDDVSGL